MKLIDLILDKYEDSKRQSDDLTGNASFRIEEKHYQLIGKEALIREAKELEEDKLLKIRWVKGYYNVDIEKVEYPLSSMEQFYHRTNRLPKQQLMQRKLVMVQELYGGINSHWIREYTEQEILPRLIKGTDKSEYDELQRLYQCFIGLDQLEAPMFRRIFSKRFLNNSKLFERELQKTIIRIARKYLPEIDDAMEDSEVLSQLYIEEYAQELSMKGSLRLEVSGSVIDTGIFPYGTVLNTQTLKNAKVLENTQINKLITIENKANFVAEPMEDGKVILFSHGYFTPLERVFLKQLRSQLSGQKVIYQHSGDLDYGGVRIFRYIRECIFPELIPYRMDIETFEQYRSFAEPIEKGPLEKLRMLHEPMLQSVINRIIETGMVLEQEAYL